jgi:hypothetical protein
MGIPLLWVFSPGNDNVVEWQLNDGLALDLTYVNDAVGTATLLDPNLAAVPGASAVAFVYVPSSLGVYRALFPAGSFNPPLGNGYTLLVSLSSPTAGSSNWVSNAEIAPRTSS